jgi:hypothetical protein
MSPREELEGRNDLGTGVAPRVLDLTPPAGRFERERPPDVAVDELMSPREEPERPKHDSAARSGWILLDDRLGPRASSDVTREPSVFIEWMGQRASRSTARRSLAVPDFEMRDRAGSGLTNQAEARTTEREPTMRTWLSRSRCLHVRNWRARGCR